MLKTEIVALCLSEITCINKSYIRLKKNNLDTQSNKKKYSSKPLKINPMCFKILSCTEGCQKGKADAMWGTLRGES